MDSIIRNVELRSTFRGFHYIEDHETNIDDSDMVHILCENPVIRVFSILHSSAPGQNDPHLYFR